MEQIEGRVILAQESRFQLLDRNGVAHHFVLEHGAPAEPEQLPSLQKRQAMVRVHFKPAPDMIAHTAMRIQMLND